MQTDTETVIAQMAGVGKHSITHVAAFSFRLTAFLTNNTGSGFN